MASPTATAPSSPLPLPPPFSTSRTPLELVSQGAEALLLRTTFLSPHLPCALKYRPPKPYRHPTLDKRLTKARILAEARILVKCGREGVAVPRVLGLGAEEGWVALSWVEGGSVKEVLRGVHQGRKRRGIHGGGVGESGMEEERREEEKVRDVLRKVGEAVGRLHKIGVVHGDLTSSNMILRPEEGSQEGIDMRGEIVLIDFGLAGTSNADEDRAVDLYVLERAFGSTHPELEDVFAQEVLDAYGQSYKGAKVVLKRLEDVRMRGRKKSMIG
ncbi:lipopolysaccharide kinase-like protein [Elsinoe australis]|uniref:EKC/KEOPS complex subunit BUD32 n=1 Tax=Elsinoe australis TaxID=40998 RepID=A0A4U7B1W7_9PEZI|nr:lipopolysaccharide kinase-like protein [Elsinoe australis]